MVRGGQRVDPPQFFHRFPLIFHSQRMTPGPSASVPYGVRSTGNIAGGVIRESYFRRSIIVVSRSGSLWCPMGVHVRTDGDDATARLVTEDHRRVQHEEELCLNRLTLRVLVVSGGGSACGTAIPLCCGNKTSKIDATVVVGISPPDPVHDLGSIAPAVGSSVVGFPRDKNRDQDGGCRERHRAEGDHSEFR